jgi:uncharacterized protein (TIGR02444 family)
MRLWDFALDYYRRDGVAAACLSLQDQAGVDVNVLIYLLWRVAVRGEPFEPSILATAEAGVAPWRAEVVQPLRNIRRRLKAGPFPAPNEETERLRGRIKAAELDAEHIELDLLESLAGESRAPGTIDVQAEAAEALRHLVGGGDTGSTPETHEALATLLRAL